MLRGGRLIADLIFLIVWIILSIQIYVWRKKHKKEMEILKQKGNIKMDRIRQIKELLKPFYDENDKKFVETSEKQITDFIEKCKQRNVPVAVWEQFVEFYGITNGVPCLDGFDFHRLDDELIFEWWKNGELWLGSCNDDVLRWADGCFCLGDASNSAYSDDYKFQTLIELLQKGFDEWFN